MPPGWIDGVVDEANLNGDLKREKERHRIVKRHGYLPELPDTYFIKLVTLLHLILFNV